MPSPDTALLDQRTMGEGAPVTLFAHGLGGGIDELAGIAGAVAGRRVLFSWPGHGDSPDFAAPWDYAGLGVLLRAVADQVGATRVVGASMGAGAALRAAVDDPGRFERLVLLTPSSVEGPRADPDIERIASLGALIDAGDVDAVATALVAALPSYLRSRPGAARLARVQATRLCGRPAARSVPGTTPVTHLDDIAVITCPVLVVAQRDDPLHAVEVAERLAGALPAAELVVRPEGGLHFQGKAETAALIAAFLAG